MYRNSINQSKVEDQKMIKQMNVDVWKNVFKEIVDTYGSEWFHTEDYPTKDHWKLIDLDGNLYQITSIESAINMMTYGDPKDHHKKWKDIFPIDQNPTKDDYEMFGYTDDYPPHETFWHNINIVHPFYV